MSMLDDEEEIRWRREHEELHRKHRGHDAMHAEMFIIFIVSMIVAQVILMLWKRKHFRSYQVATLLGLWLIPFMGQSADHIRINSQIGLQILPVFAQTQLYFWRCWVLFAYFHCHGHKCAIRNSSLDFGVHLLFYGLYYGVLGRDLAHSLTDRLACKIGYFTHDGLPKRVLESDVCAVCGNNLHKPSSNQNNFNPLDEAQGGVMTEAVEVPEEKTYTLACNHVFHEFCIRGWCMVGKLQTCPYCKEKVDLKRMFKNPWEKPHLFYGKLLDWIRYLAVWQPIIVAVVHLINGYLGLE
uniref:RING-type domain-containing protein n=1 Tax=Globodera pallida TaxID=36090 RepID=A0A183CLC3_GLOPA